MIAWKSCYLSKNMSLREHLERVHVKAHVKGMAQQIPKETDANHPTIQPSEPSLIRTPGADP